MAHNSYNFGEILYCKICFGNKRKKRFTISEEENYFMLLSWLLKPGVHTYDLLIGLLGSFSYG